MGADALPESIWSLAVHGGAGAGREQEANIDRAEAIRSDLADVLADGAKILHSGGAALDAVEDAVRRLEDSPLFNAGRGSVFNAAGEHELEASVMDGRTLDAGAAAVLRGIRNPVALARIVMERSPHVFLQGEGAIAFAKAQGVDLVDADYFSTDDRRAALEHARRRTSQRAGLPDSGTVGAVARDRHGNLAAATSTGGLTNKAVGRVGDSSIIGAGCYASNASCAVSGTGQGEYFIRATVARDIAALMEYGGKDARAAAEHAIGRLGQLGGEGGVIVVDRRGAVVFEFNTGVMLRGSVTHATPVRTGIDRRDDLY